MAFIQKTEKTDTSTPINNLDPRTKLFMLLSISILAVTINDLFFLLMICDIIILITILSDVDLVKMWKNIKPTTWLLIPTFIIQVFFSHVKDGVPLVILPENWDVLFDESILVSTGSIFYACSITLRILILALSSVLFSLTTDSNEFIQALRKIKVPYELAVMTGLIVYFLPIVVSETNAVRHALETRGVSIQKGRIIKRIKAFRILVSSLLLNFIEKSKYQAIAMDTRGFSSSNKKTTLREIKMRGRDYVVSLVLFIAIAGILYYFWNDINLLGAIKEYISAFQNN